MASRYLSDFRVSSELAKITELAATNRANRRDGYISALDRYFWLSGSRGEDGLQLHPSCDSHKLQGDSFLICNLVLRGGGTLGLAHVGFVAGLECAGIRFAGLAGASAGAIVAMGIAGARGDDLLTDVTKKIVDSTAAAPMDWFIDGPRQIRSLIKHILLRRKIYSPRIWRGLVRAIRRVLSKRGLNSGEAFETWLEAEMTKFGVPTVAELETRLARIHDALANAEDLMMKQNRALSASGCRVILRHDDDGSPPQKAARMMKLITSAMPIGVKFELPGHLRYLDLDRRRISPAKLVRMSMAIPVFFDPVRIRIRHDEWQKSPDLKALKDMAGSDSAKRKLEALEALTFIDGGVFSNLPSDSFETTMPDLPTLLVPLVSQPDPERFERDTRLSSLIDDAMACVQAMRIQRDTDTHLRLSARQAAFDRSQASTRYPRSYNIATAPISTGDADWLNFVMRDVEKQELFLNGVKAAHAFLKGQSNEQSIEFGRGEDSDSYRAA